MPRYTFEDPAKFASQVTALDNHKDIFKTYTYTMRGKMEQSLNDADAGSVSLMPPIIRSKPYH